MLLTLRLISFLVFVRSPGSVEFYRSRSAPEILFLGVEMKGAMAVKRSAATKSSFTSNVQRSVAMKRGMAMKAVAMKRGVVTKARSAYR